MADDSFACEPTTPGTQVSVRAQKGLCPGQLAQFCVCVCVMRYIFISVLFSLGVRGVCVRCGYEDRIYFGRILEEL